MRMELIRKILFITILLIGNITCFAQNTSKIEKAVDELVKKYENVKGVDCISVVKGGGLELVKTMLNKQFGKSFMKGVTSITIIDYSDASNEICNAIHADLGVFTSLLQEFNISDVKDFSDNNYIKCFALSESDRLSDFVIALENQSSKTVIYMAGEINLE